MSFTKNSITGEASIKDGQVVIVDRRAIKLWAAQHGDGTELVYKIDVAEATRSARANAYYWSVVVKAAHDHSGQSEDDIHEFWTAKFIPCEKKRLEFFNKMTGQVADAGEIDARRSSKLNRMEFFDYVELCRGWLVDFLGVTTPAPDPDWRSKKRAA